MRTIIFVTVAILSAVVLAGYSLTSSLADIRPQEVAQHGITAFGTDRGLAILNAAMKAHGGLNNWKNHQAVEVILSDEWPNAFFRAVLMPWARDSILIRAHYLLGENASRVEFLNGPDKGRTWGIQNWATYKREAREQARFGEDSEIKFHLPTLQYFFEFPFQIPFAEIVSYAGEESFRGSRYDLVFVSWNSPEPNEQIDQYVVWVNQQTKLIDLVRYTIREKGEFMTAITRFGNHTEVGGVYIPFEQITILDSNPGGSTVLHKTVLEEVTFRDELPRNFFYPNPGASSTKF